MDVFEVHAGMLNDYRDFTTSYIEPRDDRVRAHVEEQLVAGSQWPAPWLSLNPAFASGGTISELVSEGLLHPECERIFRVKKSDDHLGSHQLRLHRHQRDAVVAARTGAATS